MKQCRDSALKVCRSHQHDRVNHFEIQSRLDGLEEKFRILNNDSLADALHTRLNELSTKESKWKPEILALLLHLSDRPLNNTRVADVQYLIAPKVEPALTWAEIIADDPFTGNERSIWENVSAGPTSDDEYSYDDESFEDHTLSTIASSVVEDNLVAVAQEHAVIPDQAQYAEVKASQAVLSHGTIDETSGPQKSMSVEITDLQLIRQSLLLLHGLSTDVFQSDSQGNVRPNAAKWTSCTALETCHHLLSGFAAIASQINPLRSWSRKIQTNPLLQRYQEAISQRLRDFGNHVSGIEQRFISPEADTVVSIQGVLVQVQALSSPLVRLSQLLPSLRTSEDSCSWDFLEKLYQELVTLQLTCEDEILEVMTALFFECLEVYLRALQTWITAGELRDQRGLLFITRNAKHTSPSSLWHDRYQIRLDGDAIYAPSFMQETAPKIFAAGKSVMFLRALKHDDEMTDPSFLAVPNLEYQRQTSIFVPIPEVIRNSLGDWLEDSTASKHALLRDVLFLNHGLQTMVDALGYLFLSRDGSALHMFADGLFERLDKRSSYWNDRFVLTEMIQNTLGMIPCVDASSIAIRIRKVPTAKSALEALDCLVLDYAISWPLQNITREASPSCCQQAFISIIKVYRAKYVLRAQVIELPNQQRTQGRLAAALGLRQRLLWFTDALNTHLSETARHLLEDLSRNLATAPTVDAMASSYASFTKRLTDDMLLAANLRPIQQAIASILQICEDLSRLWPTVMGVAQSAPERDRFIYARLESDDSEASIATSRIPKPPPDIDALREQYERQLAFTVAGLRSASRVKGQHAWSTLAQRLECSPRLSNN